MRQGPRKLSRIIVALAMSIPLVAAVLVVNAAPAHASGTLVYFVNSSYADSLYHPAGQSFLYSAGESHTEFVWEGISGPNAWIIDDTTGKCADIDTTTFQVYESTCASQSTMFWVKVPVTGQGLTNDNVYVSAWTYDGEQMCLSDIGSGLEVFVDTCVSGGSSSEDWLFDPA